MSKYDLKRVLIVAFAIMLVQTFLAVTIAYAQESLMSTLDDDQDGLISLREATGNRFLLEQFNTIDADDDGFLSLQELNKSSFSKG